MRLTFSSLLAVAMLPIACAPTGKPSAPVVAPGVLWSFVTFAPWYPEGASNYYFLTQPRETPSGNLVFRALQVDSRTMGSCQVADTVRSVGTPVDCREWLASTPLPAAELDRELRRPGRVPLEFPKSDTFRYKGKILRLAGPMEAWAIESPDQRFVAVFSGRYERRWFRMEFFGSSRYKKTSTLIEVFDVTTGSLLLLLEADAVGASDAYWIDNTRLIWPMDSVIQQRMVIIEFPRP